MLGLTAWYGLLEESPASQEMRDRGVYDPAAIRRDLDVHRQGKQDFADRLFAVIQFELWPRQQETVARFAA